MQGPRDRGVVSTARTVVSPARRRGASPRAAALLLAVAAAHAVVGCAGPAAPRPAGPAAVNGGAATRPATVPELTATASRLMLDGHYDDALVAIDAILKLDPKNAFATAARPTVADRAQADEAEDAAAEAQLQKRAPGDVAFENVGLAKALDELARTYGATIEVNWKSLEMAGLDKDAPVTMSRLNKPRLDRALGKVLEAASTPTARLGHTVGEGRIVVSTGDDLVKYTVTRVYDIRDLVLGGSGGGSAYPPMGIPDFSDAPDFNLSSKSSGGAGGAGGGGGGSLFSSGGGSRSIGGGGGRLSGGGNGGGSGSVRGVVFGNGGNPMGTGTGTGRLAGGGPVGGKPLPAPPPPPAAPAAPAPPPQPAAPADAARLVEDRTADVIRLAQDSVAADSWRENGGMAGTIRELGGQLYITQTREAHRQLALFFKQVRDTRKGPPGEIAPPNVVLLPPAPPPPPAPPEVPPEQSGSAESYSRINDNPFLKVGENPLSTFSVDVDTASYSNVRRFLTGGQLPPPDAVRIEELLNYFPYDYTPPKPAADGAAAADPFAAAVEVAACPWEPKHRLVRVVLKGREIAVDKRPASNLVFLVDVSGSMSSENKLPLVKQALTLLVGQLNKDDRVSMVVYAGGTGLVLPSTAADDAGKKAILDAIARLESGGSTNGGEGIKAAYAEAANGLIKGGTNRVVLCTDGDFNVGVTSEGDLTRLIEEQAKGGVFLSVLGFGMGNLKDATMEKLADKGNGNYAYVDTFSEAKKVLVEQMSGTLITIAKDVKIQVEFNPAVAGAYRLVGYENRLLAKEDFNDDRKDAGEIGAGHAVTALYEVVPAGVPVDLPGVDELKYTKVTPAAPDNDATFQLETAKAELELKQVALRRAEAMVGEKRATEFDLAEAKLAVRLAEIKLKRAGGGGDAPPANKELLTLKLRYKAPEGDVSKLLQFPVTDGGGEFAKATGDFKFAAAVAGFGMKLRGSEHAGSATFESVLKWADEGKGADAGGYRGEFVELVKKAQEPSEGAGRKVGSASGPLSRQSAGGLGKGSSRGRGGATPDVRRANGPLPSPPPEYRERGPETALDEDMNGARGRP